MKKIRIMTVIRVIVAVFLGYLAIELIPVPSKATPNADMFLNTWANQYSPRIAAHGFDSFNEKVERPACYVEEVKFPYCYVNGNELLIVRSQTKQHFPDHLTFQADNIVAICVQVLALLAIYTLAFEFKASLSFIGSLLVSSLIGVAFFAVGFIARNYFFGAYVVSHSVESLAFWDNLSRTILPLLLCCGWIAGFGFSRYVTSKKSNSSISILNLLHSPSPYFILFVCLFLPHTFAPDTEIGQLGGQGEESAAQDEIIPSDKELTGEEHDRAIECNQEAAGD